MTGSVPVRWVLARPSEKNNPLIGYRVFDLKLGEIGVLTDYIPNKMNPVWVIESAGRDIMIPATEAFIQKVDHKKKVLYLDLPEGIMEL